jgi:hypothetical protein
MRTFSDDIDAMRQQSLPLRQETRNRERMGLGLSETVPVFSGATSMRHIGPRSIAFAARLPVASVSPRLSSEQVWETLPAHNDPSAATPAPAPVSPGGRTDVGSQACCRCHAATYERWSKTRMANVILDPRDHPDAILPPDSLLTFTLGDVASVYGSKWKPTASGAYSVQPGTDWRVPFYPPALENTARGLGVTGG